MTSSGRGHRTGISAAFASATFLGLAPVFGKQAINLGMPFMGVVMLRTILATGLLLCVILLHNRRYLYIYPAGLLGCLLAGTINGFGSLLYYASLSRINASLGQLLYSLYPLFVLLWLWLDNQPPSRLTLMRFILILPGLYFLTQQNYGIVDLPGMLMMLGSAILYALHLPINQRVLYDMPAPTVTFYTLLAMSGVVIPAYFISGVDIRPSIGTAWGAVAGLTVVTFLSRLTLFQGVKHLGGMQTALLGLGELLVTLFFSFLWLGERLSMLQWIGVILLVTSLFLVFFEKRTPPQLHHGGWLSWLSPSGLTKNLPWPHH